MFVSPCTLRSTQCAALIALAAAAGIARVETTNANKPEREGSKSANFLFLLTPTKTNAFELANNASAPWLNRVAAFAVWCLAGNVPDSSCANSATADPGGDSPVLAAEPAHIDTWVALPPTHTARLHRTPVSFPLSSVPYLFPFAVGPPVRAHHSTPNVVGTQVPGDSTAIGCSDLKVAAPDEDSSDARLARLSGPGHALAGSEISPVSTCQRRSELHTRVSAVPAEARGKSGSPFLP